MPRMRNPAHLQAHPRSDALRPEGENHYGGASDHESSRWHLAALFGMSFTCDDLRLPTSPGTVSCRALDQGCRSNPGKPERGDEPRQRAVLGDPDGESPSHGGLGIYAQSLFQHRECTCLRLSGWRKELGAE